MSSSVSSERAFSQGGITITKLRSRLKGDIVEALQSLKCAIQNDLLFREPAPSSKLELELAGEGPENAAEGVELDEESDIEEVPWDTLFIEDEDEEATYISD